MALDAQEEDLKEHRRQSVIHFQLPLNTAAERKGKLLAREENWKERLNQAAGAIGDDF